MGLLGVMLVVVAAGEVSLHVQTGVPCISNERMTTRLRAAGLTVVPPPSRRLAVTASRVDDRLHLRGRRSGTDYERVIPLTGSGCDAVERALVVLIASWSRQLPVVTPPSPVVAAPPPPVLAAPPLPREGLSEPVVEEPAVELLEVPDAEAIAPEEPVAVAEAASRPSSVLQLAQPAPSTERPLVLDLGLFGGGAAGPTSDVVTSGQFLVALGVKRIAAVADVGLQTSRLGEVGFARVQVSTQWASLSGRVRLVPTDRLELEGSLGVRGWRFEAVSNAPAASTVVFGIGGVATLGASLRVAGPIALHARAYGSLRSQSDRFVLANVGPVIELQPWELGMLIGIEVRAVGFHEAQ